MSKRSLRRKFAVLGLALVVSFVIGELLVRVLVGAPLAERLPILLIEANVHRGWAMVPGQMHYTYQHPVQVNSFGFRGRELGAKAANEVRVLALGDSLIYGQGVGDEETLPFYLERLLNEKDTTDRVWTAINAGHRSYDTHQELALLRELGRELAPDVVIVFWYWNDVFERNINKTFENLEHVGQVTFDTSEKMVGWARFKWQATQLVRRSALVMYCHDAVRNLRPAEPLDQDLIDGALRRLRAYLQQFKQLEEELSFELVFATIPDPNSLSGRFAGQALEEAAVECIEAAGVPVVRLDAPMQALRDSLGRPPVIPYDGHYIPTANRAMAELVATSLLARQAVPD